MERLTDRPIPITAALSRVERFEELLHCLPFKTQPRILHSQAHTSPSSRSVSDHQLPWTIVDVAHCIRGVQQQVQYYLLKLDTIACNWRKVLGKVLPPQ